MATVNKHVAPAELASTGYSTQTPNQKGCHEYAASSNIWRSIDCSSPRIGDSMPTPLEGGRSSTLLGLTSPGVINYGYSSIYIVNPGFTPETDPSVGQNGFSIQANTNGFLGSNGDLDAVQFTFQNSPNWLYLVWAPWAAVCVWNIDVTTQSYQSTCLNTPNQTLDYGYSATVYGSASGGMLTATFCVSGTCWSVTAPDKYGLSSKWTQLNGNILGIGNGSQAQFDGGEVANTVDIHAIGGPATIISQTSSVVTLETNNLAYASSSVSCTFTPGIILWPSGIILAPSYYDCRMQAVSFGPSSPTGTIDKCTKC